LTHFPELLLHLGLSPQVQSVRLMKHDLKTVLEEIPNSPRLEASAARDLAKEMQGYAPDGGIFYAKTR
jgi:hypothetical protein